MGTLADLGQCRPPLGVDLVVNRHDGIEPVVAALKFQYQHRALVAARHEEPGPGQPQTERNGAGSGEERAAVEWHHGVQARW